MPGVCGGETALRFICANASRLRLHCPGYRRGALRNHRGPITRAVETGSGIRGRSGSNGINICRTSHAQHGISLARAKRMGYGCGSGFMDWQKAEFMENGNHKVKIRIV